MSRSPEFVYTTYIRTTPERLWQALTEELLANAAAERRSKVSFDIEPHGDQVKLTVIHDDFEPGSMVLRMVSEGWPIKLANLKTGLEQS